MPRLNPLQRFPVFYRSFLLLLTAAVIAQPSMAWAGHFFFRSRAVGGISVDAAGVVAGPAMKEKAMLLELLRKEVRRAEPDMNRPTGMRMVSLRGLHDAIQEARRENLGELPDEIKYLAGLTRIEYVFVYPEENDVVIAGPAEGWRVDEDANVVGITTGRPVIQLDDLLVAFRTVQQAKHEGITCSIDPTTEGRRNLNKLLSKLRTFNESVPGRIEKAMGEQVISFTGVPEDSHFARVLVAADFRMKLYGMHLEDAPLKELPSFLSMMKASGTELSNAMPRWWLSTNYEPLASSDDGLAWQLRGQGVRCVSEDDFIADDGAVEGAGRANPVAQEWADKFTEMYDELSVKDAVFGELRNLMDLCVVAALIDKEGLLDRAGLSLPLITETDSDLTTLEWNTPKSVSTQCSLLKVGRGYMIAASGGVEVNSWDVVSESQQDEQVAQLRTRAKATGRNSWWWN